MCSPKDSDGSDGCSREIDRQVAGKMSDSDMRREERDADRDDDEENGYDEDHESGYGGAVRHEA